MTAGPASPRGRTASIVLALLAGALFGAGLVVSGMTQPARVLGFLDPLGRWDPSLLFVMGSALAVYAALFRAIRRHRGQPWLEARFHVPSRRDIDPPLILGAALFGIGWGLGGLCPGPGIVAAASGSASALAFVIAMLAGMYAQHRITAKR
ncbi:MAG TPA: DUF6691 family protein [Kofleriaceae bacterium]